MCYIDLCSKTEIQMARYSSKKLQQNLKELIGEYKISLAELHKNTAVPITTIHRMCDNPEANPTIASLKPIADFFNISVNQLIGDEPIEIKKIKKLYRENRQNWTSINIISWAQSIVWPSNIKNCKTNKTILTDISVSGSTFALEIKENHGHGFLKGAVIIVDPDLSPDNLDYVIAFKIGTKTPTLKQICSYEDEVYLKPLNKEFHAVKLTNEHKILGVVRQIRFDLINKRKS